MILTAVSFQEPHLKLKELGEKTGGMDYGSVALALHRIGKRLREDPALAKAYERVEKRL